MSLGVSVTVVLYSMHSVDAGTAPVHEHDLDAHGRAGDVGFVFVNVSSVLCPGVESNSGNTSRLPDCGRRPRRRPAHASTARRERARDGRRGYSRQAPGFMRDFSSSARHRRVRGREPGRTRPGWRSPGRRVRVRGWRRLSSLRERDAAGCGDAVGCPACLRRPQDAPAADGGKKKLPEMKAPSADRAGRRGAIFRESARDMAEPGLGSRERA